MYFRGSKQVPEESEITTLTAASYDRQTRFLLHRLQRAAEKELGLLLAAVGLVFGPGQIVRGTDLWLEELERTEGIDTDPDAFFRGIAIRASAALASETQSFRFEADK
jgi:hypothetical protein